MGRKREQILSQSPAFCLAVLPRPFRTAETNLDWSQLKLHFGTQDILIEKRKRPPPPLPKHTCPTFFCLLSPSDSPLAAPPAQGLPGRPGTGAPLPVAPYLIGRARTVLRNTSASPLSPPRSARPAGASLGGFGRPAAERAGQSSGIPLTSATAAQESSCPSGSQQGHGLTSRSEKRASP